MGEPAMTKTLITTALALGLGLLSTPSFAAGSYIVNGHAASPAEAQHLVASGVQQGAWVVNGYGIAPAERTSFTAPASSEPGTFFVVFHWSPPCVCNQYFCAATLPLRPDFTTAMPILATVSW
jgi:hypothetical protein